jgi:hypothetical protein
MKDLKLNLIVQALDRATAPLRRIGAGLQALEQRASKLHGAFKKLGLTELIGGAFLAGAAAEGAHAIWDLTNRVAEMGESLLRSSEMTGVSVESMQRWGWVAKQLGVDAGGLNHAFAMMEFHTGNALKGQKQSVQALQLIGLNMKEVRQLSKDPGALFTRILDGFSRIKNQSVLAVAAQGIFSRSWFEMAPLLKAPREEIARLMDQLQKAHGVMTTEDAEAAKKFIQAKQNMGLAVFGLGTRIGHALIPKLTEAIDKVTAWIESLSDAAVKNFTDAVSKLADQFVKLLPKIENLVVKAVDLSNNLLKLSDNAGVVKGAFIALTTVLATQALVAMASTTASIVGIGVASVRAAALIVGLIPAVAGLTDVMAMLDLAMDANPIGLVALAIEAVIAVIALFIFGLVELHNHWDEIVHGMEDGCRKIETAFSDLESKMPKWLRSLLNAGGAALSIQFPALGGLASMLDGLAHAPQPGRAPQPPHGGSPQGHDGPAGRRDTPTSFPALGKLRVAIDGLTPASEQVGDSPAAPASNRAGNGDAEPVYRLPLSLFRAPAPAPAASRSASQVLGTILIKADQGTQVRSVTKSADVDFRWDNRGRFPA